MARILLVEDDAHMLRVLTMWLAKNGHEIFQSRDGLMASDLLKTETIDLIVSDINMPRMSGIELTQWVRNERKLETPIILLSSRCDQEQIASDLLLSNISVHPKPFSPSRLVAQIESALARFVAVATSGVGGCAS